MTEYDYSPEGYRQFQRTQERISNWADDTAHSAHKYKNPFLPRSDAAFRDNEFYGKDQGRSRSGSRSTSSSRPPSSSRTHSHHSSRSKPTRSSSHGTVSPPAPTTTRRTPLRSHTIAVSPDDSISQVGLRPRARSHSPSRHHHSHSGKHHRSGTTTAYVVNTQTQQYGYGYGQPQYGQQYVQSPGGYYAAPQPQPQPQPAAYVVYPGDRKVQIIYPEPQPHHAYPPHEYPSQEHHAGFFSRIFRSSKSSGSGSRRSRSLSRSRR
ncbi:hypothetical protein C8F01DRAFT_1176563 [Mycena amicta]|nr:hypothetical protein C8F01DRAFT_1176563 [Mycena amicta]